MRPAEKIIVLQSPKILTTSTGDDKYQFTIPVKCTVQKVLISSDTVQASNLHVSFDSMVGTTRGAEDVGSIELPATNPIFGIYYDVAGAGVTLKAGDSVMVNVDNAGDSGEFFQAQLVLSYDPETDANMTGQTVTA